MPPVLLGGIVKSFSPKRMPFPLCQFHVNIGQPFTPPVLEGRITRDVVNSVLDMIMYRIAALLPEEYRGVYALEPGGKRSFQEEEDERIALL
ncbi:MAG TPA: hypothetical protein VFA32_16150 [Dehalococcoidia bacterium]|jgi:hypothetical protein|nr:hypothetical protein [Dehalococcoidia bacterium]